MKKEKTAMERSRIKENAKQAFGEVLGRIGLGAQPPQEAEESAPREEAEEAVREAAPAAKPAPTVIAAGTRIAGNICGEGPLEIGGTVEGDVSSRESVCVRGTVLGAVDGSSVTLSGGRVRGDISAAGTVTLDAQSVAVGNVSAACVQIDGRLKGGVTASGAARLLDRALVAGDVTAAYFSMGERSTLCGTVRILPRQEEERDFEAAFEF